MFVVIAPTYCVSTALWHCPTVSRASSRLFKASNYGPFYPDFWAFACIDQLVSSTDPKRDVSNLTIPGLDVPAACDLKTIRFSLLRKKRDFSNFANLQLPA